MARVRQGPWIQPERAKAPVVLAMCPLVRGMGFASNHAIGNESIEAHIHARACRGAGICIAVSVRAVQTSSCIGFRTSPRIGVTG